MRLCTFILHGLFFDLNTDLDGRCRYCQQLERINAWEPILMRLTDTQLKGKTGTQSADLFLKLAVPSAHSRLSQPLTLVLFKLCPLPILACPAADFKVHLEGGKSLDDLLPEAFAVVREASRRVLGLRHFDSQMVRPVARKKLTSVGFAMKGVCTGADQGHDAQCEK